MLLASPVVARSAYSLAIGWAGEQTVQYEGDAFELTPSEQRAFNKYISNHGPSVAPTWVGPGSRILGVAAMDSF